MKLKCSKYCSIFYPCTALQSSVMARYSSPSQCALLVISGCLNFYTLQGKLHRRWDLPATQRQQSWMPMLRKLPTTLWPSRSSPTVSKYLKGSTFAAQSTGLTHPRPASVTVPTPLRSAPVGACSLSSVCLSKALSKIPTVAAPGSFRRPSWTLTVGCTPLKAL